MEKNIKCVRTCKIALAFIKTIIIYEDTGEPFHEKIFGGRKEQCAHCGKNGILLSRFFGKNFVKTTVLLIKLLNSWFDEIFFGWE